MIYHK